MTGDLLRIGSSNNMFGLRYNSFLLQAFYICLRHAQNVIQYLIRMLPQQGRRHPYLWLRVGELYRSIKQLHRTANRMVDLGDHVSSKH